MTFQSKSCIQEYLTSTKYTPCFLIFCVVVGQGGILSYCYFISFDFHYLLSLWGVREKWGRKGIWVGRVGKNLGECSRGQNMINIYCVKKQMKS